MLEIENQLQRYGEALEAELLGRSHAETDRLLDDDLIDYVPQPDESAEPDEITTPTTRKRRIGIVAAVAAAILLIAGIAVVSVDRNSDDLVSDSDAPPSVTDPVSPPEQTESVPSTGGVDALGYRWSRVPYDETVFGGARGQRMKSVTVGGPGLVAVGSVGNDGDADAAVWTSVDGITWSRIAHDEAVFGGARGQWMNSVTVGGPGLVAVGSVGNDGDAEAAVWTSVDGITWSRVAHDEAVFGGAGGQRMKSVTAGGPGLVAVGSVGIEGDEIDAIAAVWTSVDGLTWSRVPHDEAVFGAIGGQEMNSVTVGGPGLVAVGNGTDHRGADVWTSVDGITWSLVTDDEARRDAGYGIFGPPWTIFGGAQGINSVIAAGPGLVAVGSNRGGAAVWTSVDGLTWSAVPADEAVFGGAGMHSVTVTGAGLVAVGASGGYDHDQFTRPEAVVWTSVDGITWSRVAHDEAVFGGAGMHSVTVAGAGLVAVGDESSQPRGPAAEWDDSVFVWVGEPAP